MAGNSNLADSVHKFFDSNIERLNASVRKRGLFYWLYQPYKWLIFVPLLVLSLAVAATLIVVVSYLKGEPGGQWFARAWCRFNIRMTPAKIELQGAENIDTSDHYIVVANHVSLYDIWAAYAKLPLDLRWVIKQELRKVPFFGYAAVAIGNVFVDRKNPEAAYAKLNEAAKTLPPGMSMMFFPEGTRGNARQLLAFKKGAFITAKKLNWPILPVSIVGTEKILPSNSLDLLPGSAAVIVHAPIPASDVATMSASELRDIAYETMSGALTSE